MSVVCGDKSESKKLTVGKVNVLGDLVPGAVVEVANLLLVLHHVGRLASLLVLDSNVVLDRLKILPVLEKANAAKISIKKCVERHRNKRDIPLMEQDLNMYNNLLS